MMSTLAMAEAGRADASVRVVGLVHVIVTVWFVVCAQSGAIRNSSAAVAAMTLDMLSSPFQEA
jgi:hypothetical protein